MSTVLATCAAGVVPAPAARATRATPSRGSAGRHRVVASRVRAAARAGPFQRTRGARVIAMAAGDEDRDEAPKPKPKIERKNEKEAWLSEMEKEGANPMKDPMAIVAIGGISIPFIILAIAGATGYIGG
mmetsp:Transcript_42859/g.68936  ORF Transcript_42859/g.68936 Transcript_42859/m.68936 type:complete len:129 (-) Transcript_42859:155-541(-)